MTTFQEHLVKVMDQSKKNKSKKILDDGEVGSPELKKTLTMKE